MAPSQEEGTLQRHATEMHSDSTGMPHTVVESTLVTYRSVGIGIFGVLMRYAGMPLEKIALYMNSSQVSGKNQLRQAIKLTFQQGPIGPYRVVGPSSLVAWFLQYSVMGFAFQFFDHSLSKMLGVKPVYYGPELMEPPSDTPQPLDYQFKSTMARMLSPILASCLESQVSNRAEVQRYFGPEKFAQVEKQLNLKGIARAAGPAFLPNATRNVIMCQTTFLWTPTTYKLYFPQEYKSKSTLFWYGLGFNIFVGNVVAITQQALWGRTLDYAAKNGTIRYTAIIREGLQKEGIAAFFTGPKWFSRVLMNCPAQGILPWFYNEVLPLGERTSLDFVRDCVYNPLLRKKGIQQ
eukprot:CAMPEP_0202446154 /NCGR_PEP_ID=MMETSP1360-20130828/4757_1 /ASSEMBLY_ACC=CAM_ASM_000848 /TAXON_ID=515479 /ORGANISM="Licmophora paradoxa, Strain CCMP2313" /LENGTH=348 /DNA_ID=CAMNT_0049062591 /DNA_START=41 /DNA_END=1087 /DNA_ORIENTATION=-